ncbi:N-formylglutamate amidohydrolase [Roseibium sp. SCPC15]|uniref:N-formylglutamate amidohydrolase n=1 Tax=Roseibium sp. SCP15 TaxID=3141376 RepID=UPI003334CDD5
MILVEEGQSPLILCLPHSGTEIPEVVGKRLNATGRLQVDLAWRLERVFGIREELDATLVTSTVSRYVIDLDEEPVFHGNGSALGRGLCPLTTLDGKRLYQEGEDPGPTEIEQRSLLFYEPYHNALGKQVGRLLEKHGTVVLLDCKSMRTHIRGVTSTGLPLVSIGTAGGTSCAPDLKHLFAGSFRGREGYSLSVDEQTRGGFITRTFGSPENGVHALTMLLAQRAYLRHESPPFEPDKIRVARIQAALKETLSQAIDWAVADSDTIAAQNRAANAGADIIPVHAQDFAKVAKSQTGQVEEEPVVPLLVAE